MKKIVSVLLIALFAMLAVMGCSSRSADKAAVSSASANMSEQEISKEAANPKTEKNVGTVQESNEKKVLVIYFSATGTTKRIAERIASVTGADLCEIVPRERYRDADLNYNDKSSRTTREQNDPSVRPEFEGIGIDVEHDYETVFLGYPIWWGEEPRIMDTFVESYRFEGKTIIPFCTSGGSGIEKSRDNLAEKAGSGTWLPGSRFGAGASDDELVKWIGKLGIG